MREYHLISADGHVIEPPDLWQRHLPARFHDRMRPAELAYTPRRHLHVGGIAPPGSQHSSV